MGSVVRALRKFGGLPVGSAIKINNALGEIQNVKVDDAADVAGGGSVATVGFQITDFTGDPKADGVVVEFGVFDDIDLGIPAINATLATPTKGTIVVGSGSPALKVKTDSTGRFECQLTDLVDETVFLGCESSSGSPLFDCREIDSVTFAA